MDDVLKLISESMTKNKYGVLVPGDKVYKEVFCQISSVTRQEFFEAGRNGLNPAFMARIFVGDYSGETFIEYEGRTYAIYRTYEVPGTDYIELYIQREGGTNGQEDQG